MMKSESGRGWTFLNSTAVTHHCTMSTNCRAALKESFPAGSTLAAGLKTSECVNGFGGD